MADTIRDSVADLRPDYDPPRALRLDDTFTGAGPAPVCNLPGSGASGDCGTGLIAGTACGGNGSSAVFCAQHGNSAGGTCVLNGNGVAPP